MSEEEIIQEEFEESEAVLLTLLNSLPKKMKGYTCVVNTHGDVHVVQDVGRGPYGDSDVILWTFLPQGYIDGILADEIKAMGVRII